MLDFVPNKLLQQKLCFTPLLGRLSMSLGTLRSKSQNRIKIIEQNDKTKKKKLKQRKKTTLRTNNIFSNIHFSLYWLLLNNNFKRMRAMMNVPNKSLNRTLMERVSFRSPPRYVGAA